MLKIPINAFFDHSSKSDKSVELMIESEESGSNLKIKFHNIRDAVIDRHQSDVVRKKGSLLVTTKNSKAESSTTKNIDAKIVILT